MKSLLVTLISTFLFGQVAFAECTAKQAYELGMEKSKIYENLSNLRRSTFEYTNNYLAKVLTAETESSAFCNVIKRFGDAANDFNRRIQKVYNSIDKFVEENGTDVQYDELDTVLDKKMEKYKEVIDPSAFAAKFPEYAKIKRTCQQFFLLKAPQKAKIIEEYKNLNHFYSSTLKPIDNRMFELLALAAQNKLNNCQ
ncbi:MAG: hypothetical protein KC493_13890 [Bacteriovoracaceae bacterium]|nr:hypothetical protein [Bacteriovoracaceae bacterium]